MQAYRAMSIVGLCAALLFVAAAHSAAGSWRDLTAAELQQTLNSGEKILLLNPLSDIEFNEGNIPGSVNIPLHTIMSSENLPEDKDTLVITYCLGVK